MATIRVPAFQPGIAPALVNDLELREAMICAALVYVSKNLGQFLAFLTEGQELHDMDLITQDIFDTWIYPVVERGSRSASKRSMGVMSGNDLGSLLEALSKLGSDD